MKTLDDRINEYLGHKVTHLRQLDAIAWSAVVDGRYGVVFFPTREYIDSLKVGDFAPNCFGRLDKVASITYVIDDRRTTGAHSVGYYTPLGESGMVSNSLTENTVMRGSAVPDWNSAEFDAVESAIRTWVNRPQEAPNV